MSSRNLAKPIFPLAPVEYDKRYMDTLVQSFSTYLVQYQNPGEGRTTKSVMTAVPDTPVGYEVGTVWLDSSLLRIGGTPGEVVINDLEVTTLDVTGVATLADADVTTLDVTGTATLADADVTTLDVTGVATLADADITTLDVTGTATLADADVTGVATLADADVTTLDVTGTATLADADVTTLDVTGVATLADADITTLDVTGTSTLAVTNISGNLTVDINTLFVDATNNRVGVGTVTPATSLHAVTADAVTNSVTRVFRVDHQTTGTPALGIGVGIELATETSNNNTEIGAVIETVTTDVSSGSEDFDLVIRLMAAGAAAAERMRVSSVGVTTLTTTDTTTNTIVDTLRLSRQSSGTPAVGIGVGIELAVETSNNNTEVGAVIEAVTTDVTATSEDFDLVFRLMAAGAVAAERFRLTSTGVIYRIQPEPTSKAAAATLTIAELLTGVIQYTGIAANLTLPTGTNIENGVSATFPNDMSFDFSVINTGSGTATVITNTGLTLVGGMTVAAGTSGSFRVRKTATNTYTVYRTA